MIQCENCCVFVIENDVGNAFQFLVAGNRHGWQHGRFLNRGIDGDDALYSAFGQQLRISAQQRLIVTMDDSEEKVIATAQVLLDSANYGRTVGIANLLGDDPNRIGPLVAESARKKVRTVVEFLCSCADTVLGVLRNRAGRGRVIKDLRQCPELVLNAAPPLSG